MSQHFRISTNFFALVTATIVAGWIAYHGGGYARYALFVLVLGGWMISLSLHEFGHALVAYMGGDETVADKGYLSLDPLKYTHPALSIVLPLIFLAMGGIGLPGGAVYIRTSLLKSRGWISATSAGGPLMTLLCLGALLAALMLGGDGGTRGFWAGVSLLAFLQLTALIFNLLPIPGLDGFGILSPYLPESARAKMRALAGSGLIFFLLIAIFLSPLGGYFFRFLFDLGDMIGLNREDIILGLHLFQFWR